MRFCKFSILLFLVSFTTLSNGHDSIKIENYLMLETAYKKALSAYKNKDYKSIEAYFDSTIISSYQFSDSCNILQEFPASKKSKVINILNDYAFFLYRFYENYAISFLCPDIFNYESPVAQRLAGREMDESKLRYLQRAEQVLKCVLFLDSSRTVAYLNIADIQYNLYDDSTNAISNWEKYASMMVKEGKENNIPPYIYNPNLRKRIIDVCIENEKPPPKKAENKNQNGQH
jgi:hypothetical protein